MEHVRPSDIPGALARFPDSHSCGHENEEELS